MKMRLSAVAALACLLAVAALTSCATKVNRNDLYGSPTSVSMAERTIVIEPGTKHVNVQSGEVVKFVVGDKEFGWNFNFAQSTGSLDLKQVAPPGVLDHTVRVYVSPDPKYIGGGDRD